MHPDARDSHFDETTTVVAVLLVGIVALVLALAAVLPADPAPVPADIARDFLPFNSAVRPEPTERLIFIVCAVLLALLATAGAWWLGRTPLVRQAPAARAAAIGASVLVAAALANSPGTRRMFRLEDAGEVLLLGAAALAVVYWFLRHGYRGRQPSGRGSRMWVGTGASITILLLPALAWRPLPVEALASSFRHYANLDVVLSPVVQAIHGRLPLTDFTSQYGLYAVFLAPWFGVTGLTVASFTTTLVALQLLGTMALVVTAVRECQSRALAILAIAAIVFVSGGYIPARFDPDAYLQYWPIRFLWPAVLTLLVQQWVRTARRRWLVCASLAGGIAVLWNVDSGIAAAGGWLALLVTRAIAARWSGRNHFPWREPGVAAAMVALPILIFATALAARAETGIDFGALLESHKRFYVTGFFMVPLPRTLHAWQVVAAVYVTAMVIGVAHALGRVGNPRAVLIHYLAFLGIGLFAYYQGRSVDQVLVAVSWPAVLIVFLCADWILALRRDGRLHRRTGDVLTASTVAFGAWCAMILLADAPASVASGVRHWTSRPPTPVTRNIDFIRSQSVPGEPLVVIARFQATYAAETRHPSALRGQAVSESVARSMGRAHVRDIETLRPRRLFVGVPYLQNSERNPYLDLLPILARDYRLAAAITGPEELRLYLRR